MAINLITGFAIDSADPIDTRIVVADATARKALGGPAFEGLIVYETGSNQLYVLVDAANKANDSGWRKIVDGSGTITGYSGSFSGSFQGDGAGLTNLPASSIVGLNLSQVATGSVTASVSTANTSLSVQSGSETLMTLSNVGKMNVSKSVNLGVPSPQYPWGSGLDGSFFSTYTSDSNVSDFLRFVAGLISESAPIPLPNNKHFASIDKTPTNTSSTTSNPQGRIPQSSTNSTIVYLNSKGWADTGSTIFSDVSRIYYQNYGVDYESVSGGSTTITSSADAQLFGLGPINSEVYVSGSITFNFEQANDSVVTVTSQSEQLISLTGNAPETVDTVTKRIINSANPAVIPSAFQDGKFTAVFDSFIHNGGISLSDVSASGYYEINATIGLASGSITSSYANRTNNTRIFHSQLYNGSTIDNTFTNSITHTPSFSALTVATRSFSGAPYLTGATYNYQDTASGVFNPLYFETSPIFSVSKPSSVGLSGTTSQAMSGGEISTTSLVFDSTGATQRSVGSIPFETDIIKLSSTATFTAASTGGTLTNVTTAGVTPSTFTITATAEDRKGNNVASGSNIPYHVAGTFGQPSDSGSLGYYGRSQGSDTNSLVDTTETFTGETYRLQITDNALSGSYQDGDKFTTGSEDYYNLTDIDAQLIPGNLVIPGGSKGYWLGDPDNTKAYKFYARAFRVDSFYSGLYLNLGTTLQNWTSTSDGVSAAIIFNSALGGAGLNTLFGNSDPTIFDISATAAGKIATSKAPDDIQNPFGVNINIYGNNNGYNSGTVYGIPSLSSEGLNQVLNTGASPAYVDFVVLIRIKGTSTSISSITYSDSE